MCWYSEATSFDHLLPRSIGGLISVNLLCDGCNSEFGSRLETEWKSNLHLRAAFEHIKHDAPLAYRNFTKRSRFVGRSRSGPPVTMVPSKTGDLQILREHQLDGTRTFDSQFAPKLLTHELQELGVHPATVADFAQSYASLPNDLWIPTPDPTTFIIKRDIEHVEPELKGGIASDAAILKIALMHVSVIIHPGTLPGFFLPLLRALKDGCIPSNVEIRSTMPRHYAPKPNHIVRFMPSQNRLTIGIQFLGILRYEVQLNWIWAGQVRDSVIVHDLTRLKPLFSPSFSAFQRGELYYLA